MILTTSSKNLKLAPEVASQAQLLMAEEGISLDLSSAMEAEDGKEKCLILTIESSASPAASKTQAATPTSAQSDTSAGQTLILSIEEKMSKT